MLFNTPSPTVVNSRQKMLAQRMIAKMHGQQHSTVPGFGTGSSFMRPPGGPQGARGAGGGQAGGTPFRGIGAMIRSHMSPGHTQMGGIPQGILSAMGIGGRGFAGQDFESFPGQGIGRGMVSPNPYQGSDQAPDYGQMQDVGQGFPAQDTQDYSTSQNLAPADRTPGSTTTSGEPLYDTSNTGVDPSDPMYNGGTAPDLQADGLTGLISIGGGRYYDPNTDSIRGGGLSQQTATRRI